MCRSILLLLLLLLWWFIPQAAEAHLVEVPVYLFSDWRYWVFVGFYTLLTLKIVLWTKRAADLRDSRAAFPLQDVSFGGAVVLLHALVYQFFHHFEHISQIFQYWYLGQHPSISRGIIFFLDLEWNHFIFDSMLFVLLVWAFSFFIRGWRRRGHAFGLLGRSLLFGSLGIQGWHAVEHTYRIIHHVRTGCEPCAGIIDQLTGVPLIPLHFWFNVFALTLPLMVFVYYRMDWVLLRHLSASRRLKGTPGSFTSSSSWLPAGRDPAG